MNDIGNNLLGKVLDNKYRIDSMIGTGGSGMVFKGTHLFLGVPIAIKILHPRLTSDDVAVKRFYREARLALTIKHPNAVSIMDLGVMENNLFYIIMDFIEGTSMAQLLETETRLDLRRAVKLTKQACYAISAAHEKNIIHRDLKPGNIIIVDCGSANEIVKVIDFSIAKSINKDSPDADLTGKDVVIGTPEYISPEQAQGLATDIRSDLYSLGVILYRMVTGDLPFKGKSPAALFMSHIHKKPEPPRKVRPEVPVELENVILNALAKKQEQRLQTADQFVAQLDMALAVIEATMPMGTTSAAPSLPQAASEAEQTKKIAKDELANAITSENTMEDYRTGAAEENKRFINEQVNAHKDQQKKIGSLDETIITNPPAQEKTGENPQAGESKPAVPVAIVAGGNSGQSENKAADEQTKDSSLGSKFKGWISSFKKS